jgi:ribosomal protein L11 methylase PrmA
MVWLITQKPQALIGAKSKLDGPQSQALSLLPPSVCLGMRIPASISFVLVTVIICDVVDAFRVAVPSLTRGPSTSRQHSVIASINDDTENDAEIRTNNDESSSSMARLRRVTFLGLTAASSSSSTVVVGEDKSNDDVSSSMDARALSEFLMEIGASSVSVTDTESGTLDEDPIFGSAHEMLDDDEIRSTYAMILSDAAVGRNLWRRCDVSAHFPTTYNVSHVLEAVQDAFDISTIESISYSVEDIPNRDWIAHVQSSWEPIITGCSKFVLRFPWHDDRRVMRACQEYESQCMMNEMMKKFNTGVKREGAVVHFEDGDDDNETNDGNDDDDDDKSNLQQTKKKDVRDYVQIRLEGGVAFGTGEHPTTRLCLGWVRDKVERHLIISGGEDKNTTASSSSSSLHFLDYGAGSGVLGIAAAAVVRDYNDKSSKVRKNTSNNGNKKSIITTIGIEIDADAIHIANDNASKNQVEMQNYLPNFDTLDDEARSVVMKAMQRERNGDGSIRPIPEMLNMDNMYDLCAANILAAPLCSLASTIARLVKSPGGEVGLSGILTSQADMVMSAYCEYFDDVKVAGEDGGWVLITGRRK